MKTKKNLLNALSFSMNKFFILLIAISLVSLSSCKSKKKVIDIEEDAVEVVNPNIMKSKTALQKILDDNGTMTIAEKEKILADIKALNLDDDELNDMITKAEKKIADDKAEIERQKEAAKPENMLKSYFGKIANAANEAEANANIDKALGLFTSPKSTVLIIIAEDAHMKDYDKPTNISKYLNYLKDTKNNTNTVDEIKWDANKKIKTLILKKN